MIGNAATFHQIDSLNTYVDEVVAENGGLYDAANTSAHVGVYAAYSAFALHLAFAPTAATTIEASIASGTTSITRQLLVYELVVYETGSAITICVVAASETALAYPITAGLIATLVSAWLSQAGGAPPDPTNPFELGMAIYDWISGWSDEDYIPDIVPTTP
jgi:hypothetical protein